MFVIAIILAGVLDDYKEAEKIPADIVCTLDALSERISFVSLITAREKAKHDDKHHKAAAAAASAPKPLAPPPQHAKEEEEEEIVVLDSDAVHYELLCLLECILEFLAGLRNEQDMLGIVSVYCKWISLKIYECQEVSSIEVWEIGDLFDKLRETLMRLSVIKRTNFIPSGQTLMKCLVFITVMLVTLAKYDLTFQRAEAEDDCGRHLKTQLQTTLQRATIILPSTLLPTLTLVRTASCSFMFSISLRTLRTHSSILLSRFFLNLA